MHALLANDMPCLRNSLQGMLDEASVTVAKNLPRGAEKSLSCLSATPVSSWGFEYWLDP